MFYRDEIERRRRRRILIVALLCLVPISGCGRKAAPSSGPDTVGPASTQGSLEWAAAGDWRSAFDKKRDVALHPVQTLRFFGVQPSSSVVDVWPGAGWWTQILAPYLAANKGKFYAAVYETPNVGNPAAVAVVDAYKKMLADKPAVYGEVAVTAFGPRSNAIAPAGTVDFVLFTHLDSWMAAGLAEKAFHDAYAALKPGGVLGVVQAKAEPGGPQDPLAANGYIQKTFVVQMANEAGFKLDKDSTINADPRDPHGRSALHFGKTPEPDRMTIRFIKPR